MKFYQCKHCNQIIMKVKDTEVPVICCGEEMNELLPNTVEASKEKHIPVVTVDGNKVHVVVGSVLHPMEAAHYIEWIMLETTNGSYYKTLKVNEAPEADFNLDGKEEILKVYAYCNLHGLWSK